MRKLAVAVIALGLVFAASSAAVAKPKYGITAKVNHSYISYGDAITVSGKVSNGPVSGKKVILYWTRASQPDSWHKIGTDTLSSKGAYSKAYKPKFGGDIKFLARIEETSSREGARAGTASVRVYQWQSARKDSIFGYTDDPGVNWNIQNGTNGATVKRKSATIDGTTYKYSIAINDGASLNLGSLECIKFRATVGVSDTSNNGVIGHHALSQLGGEPHLSSVLEKGEPGESVLIALDPEKFLQVNVELSNGNGGTVNEWVLGNPEVKCNAPK